MCCSCTMMSPRVTSLVEEERVDMDGAERDGAERKEGATESDCRDLNCASLHLTVVASMAHMIEKWSEKGKGTEKWHRICVIAEGKISLSQVAVSLYTSRIERMKCEGKSIIRRSNKEQKSSTRLCDRVIVREWMQNKGHHHVHESRTFNKGLTWCEQAITPIRRVLTESRDHLVFRHSLQTMTTRVVSEHEAHL